MKSIVLLAILSLLTLPACQQGKKKDSETSIYSEGRARCDELAEELLLYDVEVNGSSPTNDRAEATLPEEVKDTDLIDRVQDLLERYTLTAQELLDLGDTKAVVFPDREKILVSLQRSSKYLGQIYAERNWLTERSPFQNKDVDMAEYEARLGRSSSGLKELAAVGITSETLGNDAIVNPKIRKLSNDNLKKFEPITSKLSNDFFRMKTLSKRNNAWDIQGLSTAEASYEALAGVFYHLNETIKKEQQKRTAKK